MNSYMGNDFEDGTFRRFVKMLEIVKPPVCEAWVFIDEHEDNIDDGSFHVAVSHTGSDSGWVDLPASYHNAAGGLSFADGHSEN